MEQTNTEPAQTPPAPTPSHQWTGIIALEGTQTSDGRLLDHGSVTWPVLGELVTVDDGVDGIRQVPRTLPLLDPDDLMDGARDVLTHVGEITSISRDPGDRTRIIASGTSVVPLRVGTGLAVDVVDSHVETEGEGDAVVLRFLWAQVGGVSLTETPAMESCLVLSTVEVMG